MSRSYMIQTGGLKAGHHTLDFEIDNKFFEEFEESEVKEGTLKVVVELEKRTTHLDMAITISGTVQINCDRCLESYSQPISCENRLLVKYGKSAGDSDPDIISLPVGENELDIKQQLYEFIILALPIKRVHPADRNGKSTCDPEMLKKLEELIIEEDKENDPRWDELKKLMNDN